MYLIVYSRNQVWAEIIVVWHGFFRNKVPDAKKQQKAAPLSICVSTVVNLQLAENRVTHEVSIKAYNYSCLFVLTIVFLTEKYV